MRRRYRIRSRDEERYHDAVDEAQDNVHRARRDYHDAVDELEELEAEGPDSREDEFDRFYRRRSRR